MRMHRVLFVLPLILLSACTPKPDGKADIQKMAAEQSGGTIQIVWYQKTGDVALTAPKDGLAVQYAAELLIGADVYWTGPQAGVWHGKFCAKPTASLPKDATGDAVSPGPGYVMANKNTYIRVTGVLTYDSTPSGLVPVVPRC